MVPQKEKRLRQLATLLVGMAIGTAVFLALYGTRTLHVTDDSWILNGYDETDIQQHYAGWVLFRNSHWRFPLGLCDTLAAPDGTVISYTDSLPWVSIFFKLLRGVLPSTFQFFGIYTLFCFAMQGAAGALLTGRLVLWGGYAYGATGSGCPGRRQTISLWQGLVYSGVSALLFACLPTLWERAFRHVALASQYLILFSLYFYLEYRAGLRACRKMRFPWQFALLAFAAVGIHPYFLPPVMICALLAAVDYARLRKKTARAVGQFAVSLAAALAGGVLCGALGAGVSASRYGYGEISMNLNAVFNPTSRGNYTWSRLLPGLARQPAQYDGFNYLGLGVLALVLAALVYAFSRIKNTQKWLQRNGPLLAACVFLTLFAVSNNFYLGNTLVLSIPFPEWLTDLCGIFRSSGRMFYLVGACMLLFGIYAIRSACGHSRQGGILAGVLLTCFAVLQVWDLSAVAAEKRELFTQPANHTVVNDDQTQALGASHTRLLCADPDLREDRLRLLAILAGKQGL
ncbi:MAG: DUF6311 domain-containing protein, partial [Gemmiger sp.]